MQRLRWEPHAKVTDYARQRARQTEANPMVVLGPRCRRAVAEAAAAGGIAASHRRRRSVGSCATAIAPIAAPQGTHAVRALRFSQLGGAPQPPPPVLSGAAIRSVTAGGVVSRSRRWAPRTPPLPHGTTWRPEARAASGGGGRRRDSWGFVHCGAADRAAIAWGAGVPQHPNPNEMPWYPGGACLVGCTCSVMCTMLSTKETHACLPPQLPQCLPQGRPTEWTAGWFLWHPQPQPGRHAGGFRPP